MKRIAGLIKPLLLIGFVLISMLNVWGQRGIPYGQYAKIILFADSLKAHNLTDSCIHILNRRIVAKDTLNLSQINYNLAVCYVAKSDTAQVFYYLGKCGNKPIPFYDLILTDTDFGFLRGSTKWNKLEHKIDSIYLTFSPNITHKELAVELYHIFLKDQHARGLGLKKIDKNEFDHEKENLKRVEGIIAQYGWPTFSMVGQKSAGGALYVIQHADFNVQIKYIKLIEEAAHKKEVSLESYAMLDDRISTYKNGTQFYGTQVYQKKDTITGKPNGGYKYFRIRDEKNVDIRRKQMGLIPLKDYFLLFGIDYKPPVDSTLIK